MKVLKSTLKIENFIYFLVEEDGRMLIEKIDYDKFVCNIITTSMNPKIRITDKDLFNICVNIGANNLYIDVIDEDKRDLFNCEIVNHGIFDDLDYFYINLMDGCKILIHVQMRDETNTFDFKPIHDIDELEKMAQKSKIDLDEILVKMDKLSNELREADQNLNIEESDSSKLDSLFTSMCG